MSGQAVSRKATVRSEVKERLRRVTGDELTRESGDIARAFLSWPPFRDATRVGLFVSSPKLKEVQTESLLEHCFGESKKCFVPKVSGDGLMHMLQIESLADLSPEPPFNIPEPKDRDAGGNPRMEATDVGLDVFIIPGLAFDDQGRRLGRGAGYYDIYLEKFLQAQERANRARPLLAAVCFDCQVVPEVPCEDHDMRVDALVTPGKIFDFRASTHARSG